MDYRKGDIVLVAFYPVKGQEIGKLRPAIIMSDDKTSMYYKTKYILC